MKKRYWLAILCAALILAALLPFTIRAASAEGETSGQCGDTLYWAFDESTGTLTITGSGDMYDYNINGTTTAPWSGFRPSIQTVVLPEGLTGIGECAFTYCSALVSITFPASVTRIGEVAFFGCSSLTAITVPNGVTIIGNDLFRDCTSLTSVTIPDSVTVFGQRAFKNCKALTGLSIPDGVETITWSMFQDCPSLQTIVIPDSVTTIEKSAFNGCTALSSVTLGSGLTSIGKLAFNFCKALPEITIPDSVTTIGDAAFQCCTSLTSFVIPDGVTAINESVLGGCTSLTEIVIPDTVSTVGRYAFAYCSGIRAITLPESITSIGENAFLDCTALSSIEIPDSVTSIGEYAFSGCTGIRSVSISDGVEVIEKGTFKECSNLSELTFGSGLREIGWYAFSNCTSLRTVTIPEGVTVLQAYAFANCSGLASVSLPDSLETLAEFVFSNCEGLYNVGLGNGLETLNGFSGCTELKSIDVPESVRTIENNAFSGCSALATVSLSVGVSQINNWSFSGCESLHHVYFNGTEEQKEQINLPDPETELMTARWHYLAEDTTPTYAGTVVWNSEDVSFKGTTPYVIANGSPQTPRFTVKDQNGNVIPSNSYTYKYYENTFAGTAYVVVRLSGAYSGTVRGAFKIYLPATTVMTVENRNDGIHLAWEAVPGADGYVIYRRAWSSTTNGWTDFVRWNNTTDLSWIDTTVYAGTRYQYGVKAYFSRYYDPVVGVDIGGNVGDNFNLGEVGPLKTAVRITTRTLNSVTAGKKQMTVKWTASGLFTGYQVQIATNSAFTQNVKTVKITNAKTAQTVIKSLTSGKTYFARVRSYHVFNGTTYYGGWSNVLNCKVK